MIPTGLITDPQLSERTGVFADRHGAGEHLAGLLRGVPLRRPLVLAIPAGGVPVAVPLAHALGAELDVAVVSKITLPWNSEAGYGAVAFDGSCRLNRDLIRQLGLSERQVEEGIAATRRKVARRVQLFRGQRPLPALQDRTLIVVDDGLASGFTLQTAVAALLRAGAGELIVAVPTGHATAAGCLLEQTVASLCCANLRGGRSFAVASAYRQWADVTEAEARALLDTFQQGFRPPADRSD